ncbi:MAG: polysaccharide deacetylase family protein [Candidatus Poribacteria bacterium]
MCQIISILMTFSMAISSSDMTMAEKLGYKPTDKLLIIHADDIGMCHSVNYATVSAFKQDMVTCGSIMVPCPWFPEFSAYYRESPDIDVGIHLTTTSEWKYYRWGPVAPKDKVPSLIDSEGFLWHSTEEFKQHAKPEEVEIELRAQIERALQFGIKPTHLDTHMGTVFAKPEFLEIYLRLGKEYNITPMMIKLTPDVIKRLKDMKSDLADKIEGMNLSDIPYLDELVSAGSGKTYEEVKASYHNALRNLKPGINQIIVHLGIDDEELKHITNSYLSRYYDYKVFTDPETKKLIDELEIKLIGWKDMKVKS